MVSNTHFNDLAGCPLSLHKPQVYPTGICVEAVDIGHRALETPTASSLTEHRLGICTHIFPAAPAFEQGLLPVSSENAF